MNKHITYLKQQTRNLSPKLQDLVNYVLDDPKFSTWPGSCDKHHAHDGGLVEHTAEVFDGCLFAIENTKLPLDANVLRVAAIWHDYGKLWDYEHNPNFGSPMAGHDGTREWRKTSAGKLVRHLPRSYSEFTYAARTSGDKFEDTFIEAVSHCILAHHGHLNWGSPVEPKTPEAWALHLSDMLSVQCLARVKSPAIHQ